MRLVEVTDLQLIRGVKFAADCKFRQFIVTGPPGGGKSTLITKIRGWPEEGYLDLTLDSWWKSQILGFRPREIHLGIPFVGFDKTLAVFEQEWLDSDPIPEIDYARLLLPPEPHGMYSRNWRKLYAFEFVLPPPEQILVRRIQRSKTGTHPVDLEIHPAQIRKQNAAYFAVAKHFADNGMIVHVREGLHLNPMRFVSDTDAQDLHFDLQVGNYD